MDFHRFAQGIEPTDPASIKQTSAPENRNRVNFILPLRGCLDFQQPLVLTFIQLISIVAVPFREIYKGYLYLLFPKNNTQKQNRDEDTGLLENRLQTS